MHDAREAFLALLDDPESDGGMDHHEAVELIKRMIRCTDQLPGDYTDVPGHGEVYTYGEAAKALGWSGSTGVIDGEAVWFPAYPEIVYADEWTGWDDFLGVTNEGGAV